MKALPYRGLKERLGIQSEDRYLYNWRELGRGKLDEPLSSRLHSDVRGVHDRLSGATYLRNFNRASVELYITDWGYPLEEVEPGVWYQFTHPLADAQTIEETNNYPGWPNINDPYRVSHVRAITQQLAPETVLTTVDAVEEFRKCPLRA